MKQLGNNTYFGLQSELILTGTTGTFFITTDTENLYAYNGLGEPFLVNASGETSTQNNFSRTIHVTSGDLYNCITCTGSTLEDKIVQYVNTLNYEKQDTDSDIWIEFTDTINLFGIQFNETFM